MPSGATAAGGDKPRLDRGNLSCLGVRFIFQLIKFIVRVLSGMQYSETISKVFQFLRVANIFTYLVIF